VLNPLPFLFLLHPPHYRLDEEAQKRAEAEGNLIVFRKVNNRMLVLYQWFSNL
jgi:hypothetical protein